MQRGSVSKTQNVVTISIAVFVVFLVFYPLIQLIIASFKQGSIGDAFVFSLKHYKEIFSHLDLYLNSLFITIMGTLLSTVWGVGLAFILGRTDIPFKNTLSSLVALPFYITPLFGGVAWVLIAAPDSGFLNLLLQQVFHLSKSPLNIYGPWGIIWVSAIYFTPFTFLFTSGALKAMDPSLEESSYVFGANRFITTIKITLPLIAPAILGGALMTMVMEIEQFEVPAILGSQVKYFVVPTAIFRAISDFPPNYGLGSSLGISLLLFTLVGTYFHNKLVSSGNYQTITGKNFRPRVVHVGKLKWPLLIVCFLYVFIAVVLPMGVIFWASLLKFLTPKPSLMQFSLDNYKFILFEFPATIRSILNSIFLAFLGATIVVFLMGVAAWMVHRTKVKWRKLLEYTAMIPISIPSMVFSIGLLWAWLKFPFIYGTIWVLLLCYITIYLPQGFRSISSSIVQVDKVLEESAAVVGASWMYRLRTILLPLIAPGAIAAWTLVFILIMRNLGASILLASSKNPVLPVAVYNLWDQGDFTHLTALAIVQMCIVFILLGITRYITARIQRGMGGGK